MITVNAPHFRALLVFLVTAWLPVSAAVSAGSLLEEDWARYAKGGLPDGAWSAWTGNASNPVGSVQVVELESPFGGAGKSVLIEGKTPKGSGPALMGTFPATDGPVRLSFEFYIPASPGAGVLPSVTLVDSERRPGFTLNLFNTFLDPNRARRIANQGASWNTGDIITGFRFDTWYRVEISTTRTASGQGAYDITVTPFGGEPVVARGLAFASSIPDIAGIRFFWNSTNPNGAFYVTNIKVVAAR